MRCTKLSLFLYPLLSIYLSSFWLNVKSRLFCQFLQHRHKAGGASPLGVACAACCEELAGVFASSGVRKEAIQGEMLLIVYQLFNIFPSHGKEVKRNVLRS